MEYRLLGHSGLSVSRLCLGTMTFGQEADEETSFGLLDAFVEAGGTFLDTADVYGQGTSEEIIGSWLADRDGARDQVVLATKGRFPMSGNPNGAGLSRRHLSDALDASLRRLGVDAVDLYQLHSYDPLTPLEETLRFVDDAIGAGKVHYLGLSNFLGWQIAAISERALAGGLAAPVSLQPQYNLLTRFIELEITDACAEYGLGMIPWGPLAGGWLTGKYRRGERPTGNTRLGADPERGMEAYSRRDTEQTWATLDELRAVASRSGTSMAVTALAWLADRPGVTAPIIGARDTDQLTDILAAADLHLDEDARRSLDEVSVPPMPDYPYGQLGVEQRSRKVAGGR